MSNARLTALLDTLLPGDGADWPAAGSHGLADRLRELARTLDAVDALAWLLDRLPEDFAEAAAEVREDALRALEAEDPEAFGRIVTAAYSAYYTDPAIRDVIERLTGYENRPPQPKGYALEPFDERLLDKVRARKPFWRKVPGE